MNRSLKQHLFTYDFDFDLRTYMYIYIPSLKEVMILSVASNNSLSLEDWRVQSSHFSRHDRRSPQDHRNFEGPPGWLGIIGDGKISPVIQGLFHKP